MKSIKIFSLIALFSAFSFAAVAQSETQTFDVSGNCGMCKKTIEKAAKDAGATEAVWNKDTKKITVTFVSSKTNLAKIQQKIADAGYDNAGFNATNDTYNKLHQCCHYERTSMDSNKALNADNVKDKDKSCCQKGEKADKVKVKDKEKSCCQKGEKCDKEKEKKQ